MGRSMKLSKINNTIKEQTLPKFKITDETAELILNSTHHIEVSIAGGMQKHIYNASRVKSSLNFWLGSIIGKTL